MVHSCVKHFCFIGEYKTLDSFGVILKNMNVCGAHSRRPACLRAEFETTMASPSVVQILELCVEVNIRKTNKTDYSPYVLQCIYTCFIILKYA